MAAVVTTVKVYCDGSSHPGGKVAQIVEFHRRGDITGGPRGWGPDDWVIEHGKMLGPRHPPAGSPDASVIHPRRNGTAWTRYRMKCPLCSLVVVARDERLGPMLSRLTEHGVTSISLPGLAAILA